MLSSNLVGFPVFGLLLHLLLFNSILLTEQANVKILYYLYPSCQCKACFTFVHTGWFLDEAEPPGLSLVILFGAQTLGIGERNHPF